MTPSRLPSSPLGSMRRTSRRSRLVFSTEAGDAGRWASSDGTTVCCATSLSPLPPPLPPRAALQRPCSAFCCCCRRSGVSGRPPPCLGLAGGPAPAAACTALPLQGRRGATGDCAAHCIATEYVGRAASAAE